MTVTAESRTELDRIRFYIDGKWVDPKGTETQTSREAAPGELLGTASLGNEADIDAAVRAARRALDEGPWGRTTPAERAAVMRRSAAALQARSDNTATLVSRENGMPITLSTPFNGIAPAMLLNVYADLIEKTPLEDIRPSASGAAIVRRAAGGAAGAAGAGRGRRRDRAVELPAGAGDVQDRAGAGGGLHDRAEAGP